MSLVFCPVRRLHQDEPHSLILAKHRHPVQPVSRAQQSTPLTLPTRIINKAAELGVTTQEELERLDAWANEASANGTFFSCWMFFLATGTKAEA